jgi:hypothetical protein
MRITPYFIASLFLLPMVSHAQDRNDELVQWSPNHKLNWSDYKASPDKESGAAASTTTYLGIEYNVNEQGFTYIIKSKFSKNRSWGLYKTDYILSHEQGHFDLAEVYARKLNKAMSEYSFNRKTFQQDLKKIYEDVIREKEEMQNTYDEETNHSIKKAKQAEWLVKINDMLQEYDAYANYPVSMDSNEGLAVREKKSANKGKLRKRNRN